MLNGFAPKRKRLTVCWKKIQLYAEVRKIAMEKYRDNWIFPTIVFAAEELDWLANNTPLNIRKRRGMCTQVQRQHVRRLYSLHTLNELRGVNVYRNTSATNSFIVQIGSNDGQWQKCWWTNKDRYEPTINAAASQIAIKTDDVIELQIAALVSASRMAILAAQRLERDLATTRISRQNFVGRNSSSIPGKCVAIHERC